MRTRYLLLLSRLVGLLLLTALLSEHAAAQFPTLLNFPGIPCDSTLCDSLVIINQSNSQQQLLSVELRDSVSYGIGAIGDTLPRMVPAGDSVVIPICFTPGRRGSIVDSLLVRIGTDLGVDSLRVRLVGRGLGSALEVDPSVLNFPKTNVFNTAMETIVIRNIGELPYELTAAALTIPPPFQVWTPLPVTILPGDSVELEIMFQPVENGVYSITVDLAGGCHATVQLGINGVTELIGTGAVLRISKIGFNPANNEQTPCDLPRCTELTFSNVGNAPLLIESLAWQRGDQGFTFTPPPPVPFIVPANGQRNIQVCLSRSERAMLADTLVVASNTRGSIAFGMVIDVSGSMVDTMRCGNNYSTRMEQAIMQAKNFVQRTLLHIPSIGIQDQLAISSYSSYSAIGPRVLRIAYPFPLTSITDADRLVAQNAIAGLRAGGGTPTGAALQRMIDTLAKSPLRNRVIVLLTDGEAEEKDLEDFPLSSTIELAKRHGVKIFTIGVGLGADADAINYLRTLSSETNAASFNVSDEDCQTLQTAFESITDLVSRGTQHFEPFAIRVIAPSVVATPSIRFDSIYVRDTLCSSITLTNVGEGVAIVDAASLTDLLGNATSDFYLPPDVVLPIRIPESEMMVLPICFNPQEIRTRGGKLSLRYNNCGQGPITTDLTGAAYAEANLRLSDLRIGLPGDVVTLPLYADSSMGEYSIRNIRYEVRWNSSMLDLRAVRPRAGAFGATVELAGPVSFVGNEAIATISATYAGTGEDGIDGGGELAELEFQVLRGNALFSEVKLTSATFEDGNPRTLLANAGMIAFDSTCFRESKPLSNGGATKILIGDATPTPALSRMVSIPVTADGESSLSVELYSSDGALVRPAEERFIAAGTGRIDLDLSPLPAGSYYAVLKSGPGESFFRKILIAR